MKKEMNVSNHKRDRTRENLMKNIKTLMKNSNKLRKYGADARLLIYWKGQYWEYTSFISPSNLPSTEALVSLESLEIVLIPDSVQRKRYPKPIQKTPVDYDGKDISGAVDTV
jgi:hypothetical protein